ncbi:hypothetical protein ITJ86_10290 [Winogradskyella sp. F6397]|uniref:Uncharacterized protein n=1 Tax=Winogradskyella marina TaxID=2785530 RepID=A0ABS0EJH4_9FLAO|nr:hypothetical protein [Winogradskyella marina]MBF8150286.1 hypothetical protein [Winogradskyella marina]
MASAIIYPESDSETLKAAGISYLDYSQLIGVALSLPARTGLVEVLDEHPTFDIGFMQNLFP